MNSQKFFLTYIRMEYLSKEQKYKKCFLQLSKKFRLPYDIIIYIWNTLQNDIINDQNNCRLFHKNILLLKMIDNTTSKLNKNPHIRWKGIYDEIHKDIVTKDIYQYRLPLNNGCEWAIRTSEMKLNNLNCNTYLNSRVKLLKMINIFGEKNYLMKKKDDIIIPCDTKLKIKYLNLSPWDEVINDYNDYLEHMNLYNYELPLIIDKYGEASFNLF